MNLTPFSFFQGSTKVRVGIAAGGSAAYYGWLYFSSPSTITRLININFSASDPLSSIRGLDPLLYIPPVMIAGGFSALHLLSKRKFLQGQKPAKSNQGDADVTTGKVLSSGISARLTGGLIKKLFFFNVASRKFLENLTI